VSLQNSSAQSHKTNKCDQTVTFLQPSSAESNRTRQWNPAEVRDQSENKRINKIIFLNKEQKYCENRVVYSYYTAVYFSVFNATFPHARWSGTARKAYIKLFCAVKVPQYIVYEEDREPA